VSNQLLQAARRALEFIQSIDGYENSKTANELRQAIEAAQQGVQADGACMCGHQWSSHNRNGCCWDEECECTQPRR